MPGNIVKRRDHGDMLKRDFVLFVVSAMLRGHQNRCCNFRILKSLIHVGEIKEYNWCAYTYKSLIDFIHSFQKNPAQFFTGLITFLLVLQLVYFDRVQFKGMRVNKTYPIITGWTADLAKKRLREEKSQGDLERGKLSLE